MAIYHCSIKPVSRGAGRSGTAAAAYRAGVCLEDKRTGEIHDYTRRTGVEHSEIIIPAGVKAINRENMWNDAEAAERRKDARVGREFELALPTELTKDKRRELTVEFAKSLVNKYGVGADVAIHEPNRKGDQRNHHAHILITTRKITSKGMGEKTSLEREDKALKAQGQATGREQIIALRAQWARLVNHYLEQAGYQEKVNHKSFVAQGVEHQPTIHLGPTVTAMERRGELTERGDINRGVMKERINQAELSQAEKIQGGVARMRAQARQRLMAFEQAKQQALAADKAMQKERERCEQEARQELAKLAEDERKIAEIKQQAEKERLRVYRAFEQVLKNTPGTVGQHHEQNKKLLEQWEKAEDKKAFEKSVLEQIRGQQKQKSKGPSPGR